MFKKILSKKYFIIILLILLTDVLIFFNVPFFRSFAAILLITFLPGFLIIKSLNLNMDGIKIILLSIGSSLSFLMIYFVAFDYLSLSMGYLKPLSLIPVIVSLNVILVILTTIANRMDKDNEFNYSVIKSNLKSNLKFSNSEKLLLIPPIYFVALSFLGVYFMNYYNNNIIIVFLIVSIATYIILITYYSQKATNRLYLISIFLIGLSVIFLMPLRSIYITGADTNLEYYYFITTLSSSHWVITGSTSLDACLSISILPATYQILSNIKSEILFKFMFPIIISTIPLIIYIVSKKYLKNSYAFLAAFFFISQVLFINAAANTRTFMAILFVALIALVIFDDQIPDMKKMILFILFLFSCILSHYSTAYIIFAIFLISLMGMTIFSRKFESKSFLTVGVLVLFFCLIYFWYSQVTQEAFDSGVVFIVKSINNLNHMFIQESQSSAIQTATGANLNQSNLTYKVNFILNWLVLSILSFGVLSMIVKFRYFISIFENRLNFLKSKIEPLYFMIVCACFAVLIIVFTVPQITKGYDMTRTYSLTLVFLSVVFIIGNIIIAKIIKVVLKYLIKVNVNCEKTSYLLILIIILPFFFSVSGVNYVISGNPQSMIFSSSSDEYKSFYITDQESSSSKWINITMINRPILTDHWGRNRLVSQGEISFNRIVFFGEYKKLSNVYLYLRKNALTDYIGEYNNSSNIIYNSGDSEIGFFKL
ncbi:MAG TPA: DUF2206 domain-containing protein [Methanobacterium subterraneum]|uniref:DUF2206 domain-containing protein n=1 Tax=Methanobacterium subterraneum TaxID=59277 RepID=A0A7J4TK92_9EURY|nr:DUF2206 domain-containing protein [Methanobacterium subterraneum]